MNTSSEQKERSSNSSSFFSSAQLANNTVRLLWVSDCQRFGKLQGIGFPKLFKYQQQAGLMKNNGSFTGQF